jgi:membrane associated rhomboid family serine protease
VASKVKRDGQVMSSEPAKAEGGKAARTRRTWSADIGDPETVLANARRALFVMAGILVVLWAIQIANVTDSYHLTASYGIRPRDVLALPHILTAPFLHFSWSHIEGNSGPLFIFGFLAAYRGLAKFAAVTVVVVLTSGFAAWFFEAAGSIGAGASGVVFGYFGYIMVRGLFDRHLIDVLIGAVMALCFAYQFAVLLPHQGIGWQAHVGGLVGGIACGWLLRDRRVKAAKPARVSKRGKGKAAESETATGQVATTTPSGKGLVIDSSNPRADLYKELDDLGL